MKRTGILVPEQQRMKIIHTYEARRDLKKFKIPFINPADITSTQTICVQATVDDGSGLCAIDSTLWA